MTITEKTDGNPNFIAHLWEFREEKEEQNGDEESGGAVSVPLALVCRLPRSASSARCGAIR